MNATQERCPAPPHVPPGDTWRGRLLYKLRTVFDLQVASVIRDIQPWLAQADGRLLDVGCGAQPYRHLLPPACAYQGLDWGGAKEHFDYAAPDTVYYDGEVFPFDDASFDCVLHTEVLEHVYEPEKLLRECRRVLKPGGRMMFTVPFQARFHYIPHDYWRPTPASLERLLHAAGFARTVIRPRGTDITVIAYKIIGLACRLLGSSLLDRLLGLVLAPVAFLIVVPGQLSMRLGWGSSDDCLGYTVSAVRPHSE